MDEDTKRLVSKSQISTYDFCPLQYKKRYVDGIKSETNMTLATGTRVHDFCDTFFDHAKDVPPEDWYSFIHPDFSEYEQKMLKTFMDYEWSRLKIMNFDYDAWMPVLREAMVVNDRLGLRGIIDRVDKVGNDYILVEYKTSKSIYRPSLQKEFGFYKFLMNNTQPYDTWNITMGCVINVRLGQVEYMAPSYESTILKRLTAIHEAKQSGIFLPTCSEAKFAMCKLCDIDEAGLFNEPEIIGVV
jgi:NADH:ubiquinone oxidoreductase subunit